MKSIARCIVFMCVFAVPVFTASAQITIDTNDVKSQFAVGKSLTQYADTITTSINIGSPGSTANNWNFSGLRTHTPLVLTSVTTVGAPRIAQYPGTTHALVAIVPFDLASPLGRIAGTTPLYQYLRLSGNMLSLGTVGSPARASISPLGPLRGTLQSTNGPFEVLYRLPMTMGTSWQTGAFKARLVVDIDSPFTINPAYGDSTSHDARYVVDGFGTLTLPPPHASQQALRIRKIDFVNGTPTLSYTFISKVGAIVNVTASDTLQNSGTINIFRTSTRWNGPLPTDVRVSEAIPTNYALMQNYPNPFNPSTTIRYEVAAQGFVSIKLYNLLGQEVATLLSQEKSPGAYELRWDAGGIPSGVYLYRMLSGSFTETRRMVLLK